MGKFNTILVAGGAGFIGSNLIHYLFGQAGYEGWYTEHRNLFLYFLLIFLTAWSVVRPGSDAYQRFFKDLPPVPKELEQYMGWKTSRC